VLRSGIRLNRRSVRFFCARPNTAGMRHQSRKGGLEASLAEIGAKRGGLVSPQAAPDMPLGFGLVAHVEDRLLRAGEPSLGDHPAALYVDPCGLVLSEGQVFSCSHCAIATMFKKGFNFGPQAAFSRSRLRLLNLRKPTTLPFGSEHLGETADRPINTEPSISQGIWLNRPAKPAPSQKRAIMYFEPQALYLVPAG
jgi:hypothetical protein